MAQNPLLGKRISLISKKNIRYEGLLYSINEQNATVALQNVKSFGTEGREIDDDAEITSFVAPSDAVHPYLLFRGQDIKDLHVHESQQEGGGGGGKPAASSTGSDSSPPQLKPEATEAAQQTKPVAVKEEKKHPPSSPPPKQPPSPQQQHQAGVRSGGGGSSGGGGNRRPRKQQGPAVGTGASLLHRKARGVVAPQDGGEEETVKADFDFQSHNDQFVKDDNVHDDSDDDEAGDEPATATAYEKDDFFDSISCDTIDKQSGVDNRLRGQKERHLNTETFGAVALNSSSHRRRRGGRGGRGRGRGGGRGRGRGSGRGGRGGRGRYNSSWNRGSTATAASSTTSSGQAAATTTSSS